MIKYRNFRKSLKIGNLSGLESVFVEILLGIIFFIIALHSFKSEMLIVAIPLGLLSVGCTSASVISLYFYIKLRPRSQKGSE